MIKSFHVIHTGEKSYKKLAKKFFSSRFSQNHTFLILSNFHVLNVPLNDNIILRHWKECFCIFMIYFRYTVGFFLFTYFAFILIQRNLNHSVLIESFKCVKPDITYTITLKNKKTSLLYTHGTSMIMILQ